MSFLSFVTQSNLAQSWDFALTPTHRHDISCQKPPTGMLLYLFTARMKQLK